MRQNVFIVKSNYKGEHGQGNILGVHANKKLAMLHFNDVRDDRCRRAKIAWDQGPENSPFRDFQRRLASFYVIDEKMPEIVELLQCRINRGEKYE